MNAILLYLSCYKINKQFNLAFIFLWILNFFIVKANYLNQVFTYINLLVFVLVYFVCSIRKSNKFTSSVSILIYSIFIDIICYIFIPIYPVSMSLFNYILNGILFNIKFAIAPIAMTLIIETLKKIKPSSFKKFQFRENFEIRNFNLRSYNGRI